MPTHSVECVLPYSKEQLYDLVANIEDYPSFLPWIEAARIIDRESESLVLADLVVHFRGVRGKYTSRVLFRPDDHEISVELEQGPFHHLYQIWKFSSTPDGTRVDFDIDFSLRSKILEKVMDLMFDTACNKMMECFITRANELYSDGKMNVES